MFDVILDVILYIGYVAVSIGALLVVLSMWVFLKKKNKKYDEIFNEHEQQVGRIK